VNSENWFFLISGKSKHWTQENLDDPNSSILYQRNVVILNSLEKGYLSKKEKQKRVVCIPAKKLLPGFRSLLQSMS
jgi:hypothetical protein